MLCHEFISAGWHGFEFAVKEAASLWLVHSACMPTYLSDYAVTRSCVLTALIRGQTRCFESDSKVSSLEKKK